MRVPDGALENSRGGTWNDSQHREATSLYIYSAWSDGFVTRRPAAGASNTTRSELPRLRRSARIVRHAELLERHLESPIHPYWRSGAVAISSRSGHHRALLEHIFDGVRLSLLSLESERSHLALGPSPNRAQLHGDPCYCDRGARR